MGRTGAAPITFATTSEGVSPVLLRNWLGRVQQALLRGVRLRDAVQPQVTTQLELLANELDSVAEQIRCALRTAAKAR
ncbi:MAG TPA: hypothetical protein VKE22_04440 [Haliangiales bacterium]|nr:hypothetical protein [Haliangiales bacterium]